MKELCGPFFLMYATGGPTVILGWQAYAWLKFGFWTPLPLIVAVNALGVELPQVQWTSIQKIIEYIFGCPLSSVMFLTFAALSCLAITIEKASRRPTG